jgi:peroxiredoxin
MLWIVVSVVGASAGGATLGQETKSEPSLPAGKEVAASAAAEPAEKRDDGSRQSPARPSIPEENLIIPEEMQACAAGLRKIYTAVDKYEQDKGTLPDWLSELVPDYLKKEALLCPCSGRQKTSIWVDPKLPCSFTYEFSPTRLRGNWGPVTGMTCREWKTRQVNFLGDVVPLVRCKHGSRVLSLSFGGRVFCSPVVWENLFIPGYRRGDELPPDEQPFDYTLPTGGVAQLYKFITDLSEFRAKTPYQTAEHRRRAPVARTAAATRILRLERNQWSDAYQAAIRILLDDRIRSLSQTDLSQQKEAVGFITMFLKAKAEKTIQPEDVRLALSAGRALEEADNFELAAQIYQRAAELVAQEDDEKLSFVLRLLHGASRRLELEGKEVVAEGTQMDGAPFDWEAYRGKVVLVQFWAAESDVCRAELPRLKLNYGLYHDRGLEVIAISTDQNRRALEDFLAEQPLPWVVLHSEDPAGQGPTVVRYGVTGVPTTWLVDKEGKAVSLHARGGELDMLLHDLLGPPYVPKGKLSYVDLQPNANQKLAESFEGTNRPNDLAELPTGEQAFGGVKFRIGEGLIHVARKRRPDLPTEIEGIPVNRKLTKLYMLQGTQWGFAEDGTLVGEYRVHYEDGTEETIPIVLGEDLRDWWNSDHSQAVTRGKVVWVGENEASRRNHLTLRLYLAVWDNPHPGKNVVSVDLACPASSCAGPFCVAMTSELQP